MTPNTIFSTPTVHISLYHDDCFNYTSVRKKCPLEYLQVQMTNLVSLLFIAMIPIDYKIINFSLHWFVYFFLTIIIFGEFTSATSKERMTTNIIFAGAALIN